MKAKWDFFDIEEKCKIDIGTKFNLEGFIDTIQNEKMQQSVSEFADLLLQLVALKQAIGIALLDTVNKYAASLDDGGELARDTIEKLNDVV